MNKKTTLPNQYEYDIALSFAGEEREYVEAVAQSLYENGVNVFYDKFEEANLWGKDLYVYLNEIYKNHAKYTIMFISKNYAKKLWTTHERKAMQERAFRESEEYILPARFDDTEIPGESITIGYINLENKEPNEFSDLVLEKLQIKNICISLKSLQNALLTDKESGVRMHAAVALGNTGNRAATPALTKALLNDEHTGVRMHSAVSLGKIGDQSAVSALSQALENDKENGVRMHCSNALGIIMKDND